MTRPYDTDLTLAAWMQDGPTSGPPDVLASALAATRSTRQRPAWVVRWGDLPGPTRMAVAAVATVLVVALGFSLVLGRPSNDTVGGPPARPGTYQGASPTPSGGASDCMRGFKGCLGPLAAGTYTAPGFGIDFTVPTGWTNLTDDPGWFLLAPQDESVRQNASGRWLAVIPDAVVSTPSRSCSPTPMPDVDHTADAIVTYLTGHEGLVTSNVTPVTVGGLSGKSLDLSVAPTWTTTCTGESKPSVSFLTENNNGGWRWAATGAEHQHMIFLDDGAGGVIAIAVNTPNADGFDAMVQAAAPIVDSFRFHRGSASPAGSPGASP